MVFLKLFLRLSVVLLSSPLKIQKGFGVVSIATVYMLWEMISIALVKNASFAFIMDANQMEYRTIFFSGCKVQ